MADCDILEDLKALEPGLAERQDLLNALNSLRDEFLQENSNNSQSTFGIKVTPAAPKFHANYPRNIELDAGWADGIAIGGGTINDWEGTYNLETYDTFYLVGENLNHFPVWDAQLQTFTNGIENNAAFALGYETDDSDDIILEDGTTTSELCWDYTVDPPILSPSDQQEYNEYLANPNDPEWQMYEIGGGGRWVETEVHGFTIKTFENDPENPIWYNAYDPSKKLITSGTICATCAVEPNTGLVRLEGKVTNLPPGSYNFTLPFIIQNGNGGETINITFHLSNKNTGYVKAADINFN